MDVCAYFQITFVLLEFFYHHQIMVLNFSVTARIINDYTNLIHDMTKGYKDYKKYKPEEICSNVLKWLFMEKENRMSFFSIPKMSRPQVLISKVLEGIWFGKDNEEDELNDKEYSYKEVENVFGQFIVKKQVQSNRQLKEAHEYN